MNPLITVRGNWATASHIPEDIIDAACSAMDDAAPFTAAFREGRWDGMCKLNTSAEFPAGLVDRVVAACAEIGKTATVRRQPIVEVDMTRFDAFYLPGVELRWYQVELIKALLGVERGIGRAPTGSGKTLMAIALAKYLWEENGWRTLVVEPKKGLLHQTRKEFQKYMGPDLTVGALGDSLREPGEVVIATAATLLSAWPRTKNRANGSAQRIPIDMMVRDIITSYEVLILDETHHASAEGWYDVTLLSKAKRRYGLSGTPLKDKQLPDLRLEAATGNVLYSVKSTTLIDEGTLAKPRIVMVMSPNASGPDLPKGYSTRMQAGKMVKVAKAMPYKDAYVRAYTNNEHHNTAVVRAVCYFVDRKKRTLLLCRQKAHFRELKRRLEAEGVNFHAVWGDSNNHDRDKAKELLNSGHISCVLASTIWDEGEDVPGIDAVVLAEGVKINTNSLQRIGRGMRKKKGLNEVWVVDFVPTCHSTLMAHALERCMAYEADGFDTQILEEWPAMVDTEYDENALLPFEFAA